MLTKEKYRFQKYRSIEEFLIVNERVCPGRRIYAAYVNQDGLNIAL